MSRTVRLLLGSQLCLWIGLFVCFLLIPHFLLESDEGGVSNYGVYTRTIAPYTLAFSLCGLLTIQAAYVLPKATPSRRLLQSVLIILGLLYLLILLTTYLYQVNNVLDDIHVWSGAVLFLVQTITGAWLTYGFKRDAVQALLLAALLIGIALSVLTIAGLIHVLFVAEGIVGLAFGALLVRSVGRITALPKTARTRAR